MPEPSIKTLLSLPRTRLLKIQSEEWPDRRNITFRRRITRFILCDLPHHRYPWRCRPSFQVAADGHYFAIYDDGHHRQLPRLTSGPFKYKTYSYENFKKSAPYAEGTGHAMKSAVITPSMLYLLYPLNGNVEGYSKEQFIKDLVNECEKDIRGCFEAGAKRVSIDFTEGRLASKKDSRNPWTCAHLLKTFVDLNNKLLYRFSAEERANIGIHTCPGGDCDSVHSGEVPYAALLPSFFAMNAGYVLIQLASEKDKTSVYKQIGESIRRVCEWCEASCFHRSHQPVESQG